MSARLRQWTRGVLRPLTLAQALSSAAGVVPVFIGATQMDTVEFTRFSLLTLVSGVVLGLVIAAVLQPALINQRLQPDSLVPFRYAALCAVFTIGIVAACAWVLRIREPWSIMSVAITAACPVLYMWLRFRFIGLDARWPIVQADALRLVLIFGCLLHPSLTTNAVALQTYTSLTMTVPTLFLLAQTPKIGRWLPYRHYSKAAGWQVLDYGFGQCLISLPLLLLGAGPGSSLIGGVRLAQSLLGPLNLIFAAAATNLVADGATRKEYGEATQLISRGIALGRKLTLFSVCLVGALLAALYFSGLSLKGVGAAALLQGVLLVGASAITTGWAGVHAVILRLLDYQATVTLGRAVIAVVTTLGFLLGYHIDGVDGSLVCGFLALGISSPLAFGFPAARYYKVAESDYTTGP